MCEVDYAAMEAARARTQESEPKMKPAEARRAFELRRAARGEYLRNIGRSEASHNTQRVKAMSCVRG